MAKNRITVNPHALKRLLEQNFDIVRERSNDEEITIICQEPGCRDRTGNCAINVNKGLVHCWVCNYSGHVTRLLRNNGVDFEASALDDVVANDGLASLGDEAVAEPQELPVAQQIELPAGFTPIAKEPNSPYSRLIAQMARRKKLYFQDFVDASVGFTRLGEWEPFAIFPVYELGRLVYYQGRTYAVRFEGGVTKRFPRKTDVPIGAGNWLYGYDRAVSTSTKIVVVVESILNVLSLRWELHNRGITGVEPVAVFKHKISKAQAVKLAASPAVEVCILYDGDATASAWEEAKKLSGNRIATVATMPVGIDANDDVDLALERFNARKEYSPANELADCFGV